MGHKIHWRPDPDTLNYFACGKKATPTMTAADTSAMEDIPVGKRCFGCHKAFLLQRGLAKNVVRKADDIVSLPWIGNHLADMPLFEACCAFIRRLSKKDESEAKRALGLMFKHGMGIEARVDNKLLAEYIAAEAR